MRRYYPYQHADGTSWVITKPEPARYGEERQLEAYLRCDNPEQAENVADALNERERTNGG